MTSMSHSGHDQDSDTIIDARHTDGPVTLVRIESAIRSVQVGTVLAILTTEFDAEQNLRSLCRSTDNEYLGFDQQVDHDVHWIRKTNEKMQCEACSSIRTIGSAVATIAVLTYTTPDILMGDSSIITTMVFILAVMAIPPVSYNNFRLARQFIKRAPPKK